MTLTARAHTIIQVCVTLLMALTFTVGLTSVGRADDELTTIYIVRHAEKEKLKRGEKDPPGPGLTDAGRKRAETLAVMMKDAGVKAIYINNYLRTQQTAEPTARETGAKVSEIKDAAETIRAIRKEDAIHTFLIVGRSNTVDDLGSELGVTIPTLNETQYDRMFIVRMRGDKVELETSRYGEKSPD
ncbi:SixA phosphatase family protein [Pararhizobium gei]|uniref:SixA phosphatase family protein n=1 Tax=Pararhizobium gei TaxID=1395951 RepID=UPI0023DC0344|nr:histidine phosphatase family protein [Rhizobium gei]